MALAGDVLSTYERTQLQGLPLQVLRFAITFAIAVVSYRFLERPIRTARFPLQSPPCHVAGSHTLVALTDRALHGRPGGHDGRGR